MTETIKPKNTNISGATSETEVTSPVIPEDLQKSYPQKRISIAIIMGAIINLFCIIGVIILIINSLASDKSDDEVNSYLSLFSVVTIILIPVSNFTPTSALALVGPGVSLSEWIAEYLLEFLPWNKFKA
ncbi:413_t:CDS:2 [Rhizophagus irregularis]|nr:413_t:CDS:2 [Rhizophagus irregularis]